MILQLLRRHFFRIEDEYVLALRVKKNDTVLSPTVLAGETVFFVKK